MIDFGPFSGIDFDFGWATNAIEIKLTATLQDPVELSLIE